MQEICAFKDFKVNFLLSENVNTSGSKASLCTHVFIGKLALLKQLDKETFSHTDHPRILSLRSLELEQTWPARLLNEADKLLWFVIGIAPSRSEPLITEPGPRSSAQVITRSASRWITWDLLVPCTCRRSRSVVEKQVSSLLNNSRSYTAPIWAPWVLQLQKARGSKSKSRLVFVFS